MSRDSYSSLSTGITPQLRFSCRQVLTLIVVPIISAGALKRLTIFAVVPDMESLDRSHLNEYGARYIAWLLACELKHVECIREYIQENPEEPAKDMLLPWPEYEMPQLSV